MLKGPLLVYYALIFHSEFCRTATPLKSQSRYTIEQGLLILQQGFGCTVYTPHELEGICKRVVSYGRMISRMKRRDQHEYYFPPGNLVRLQAIVLPFSLVWVREVCILLFSLVRMCAAVSALAFSYYSAEGWVFLTLSSAYKILVEGMYS